MLKFPPKTNKYSRYVLQHPREGWGFWLWMRVLGQGAWSRGRAIRLHSPVQDSGCTTPPIVVPFWNHLLGFYI